VCASHTRGATFSFLARKSEMSGQADSWPSSRRFTLCTQSSFDDIAPPNVAGMFAHKSQQDATTSDIIPPQLPNIPQADERDPMHMFLYFNLSYPTPLDGSVLSIVAARLKLYKFSQVRTFKIYIYIFSIISK
jgi:hypothetical protein